MNDTVLNFYEQARKLGKMLRKEDMGLAIVELPDDVVQVYFEPGGRKLTLDEAFDFAQQVMREYTLVYMMEMEHFYEATGSYLGVPYSRELSTENRVRKALESQRGWAALSTPDDLHGVLDRVSRNKHAHTAAMTRAYAEELIRRIDPALHGELMREYAI